MNKKAVIPTLITFLSLAFPSLIQAREIVLNPGKSIQSAIDSASVGDTITVMPGEYLQSVTNIKKDGIKLICKNSRQCKTKAILVYSNNVTVSGFEITDPKSDAGIRTMGNDTLIENNEIHHTMQDGIWFFGQRNTYRNNYIHDILDPSAAGTNDGDPHVDCFQTWDWTWPISDLIFEGNICDHTRTSLSNQMVIVTGSSTNNVIFRNNRFIMHDADSGYNPLALYGGTGYTIENNYFCNTAGVGSVALYVSGGKNVTARNNTYAGYSSFSSGSVTASGNTKTSLPCVVGVTTSPSPSPSPALLAGDLDADGDVDLADYNRLVNNFGNPYTLADYNNVVTNYGKKN